MGKIEIQYTKLEELVKAGEYDSALALLRDNKSGEAELFTAFIKLRQDDKQGYLSHIELAVKGKCPKACGFQLDAYRSLDEDAEAKFAKKHAKEKDALTRYLSGKHFLEAKKYAKALPILLGAKELAAKEMKENTPFSRCYVAALPFRVYLPENVFAGICRDIMHVLQDSGSISDRKLFIECWKDAVVHYTDDDDKLLCTMSYLLNVVDNTMGLADYRNSIEAFPLMEQLYAQADEEFQEEYEDTYELICRLHGEFMEKEKARLQRQNITYSEGLAKQNFLTVGNILNALAGVGERIASTPKTTTKKVYTIDGKQYEQGGDGYLYDESGMKSEYSVNAQNRLEKDGQGWNEKHELGYFNDSGQFISNY